MCGVHLRTSSTIDKLQPAYSAGFAIGAQNNLPEYAVAHNSRGKLLYAIALLLKNVRCRAFIEACERFGYAGSREQRFRII